MNPRTNLLILILSAIAGIIGFVLMSISNSEIGPKLALGGSAVSQLAAIIYLWPSSTITQKKIWKFMIGAVVLTTIGAFAHNYSSEFGSTLSFVGYISVIGLYFIHFVQKNKRRKLDIIKLTWVVFTYLLMMLNALFDRLPIDLEFFTTPLLWYGAYLYYKQQNNLLDERHKAGW